MKDVTYELDKKLILCEGRYYPEEEDIVQKENTYVLGTELKPDEHGVFTRRFAEIDGNICDEFDLNDTWSQQAIRESLCENLKTFYTYIPPFLTIKEGSRKSVVKLDYNTIQCGFMPKIRWPIQVKRNTLMENTIHLWKTQCIYRKHNTYMENTIHLPETQYIYRKHNKFTENTIHLRKTQ